MNWTRVDTDDNNPCSSDGCEKTPEWYGEAGEKGSVYCQPCRLKIENQPPMMIEKGAIYRHRKSGKIYVVTGLPRTEATMGRVVAYREKNADTWADIESDDHFWTRPLAEFSDGRFERIGYRGSL